MLGHQLGMTGRRRQAIDPPIVRFISILSINPNSKIMFFETDACKKEPETQTPGTIIISEKMC